MQITLPRHVLQRVLLISMVIFKEGMEFVLMCVQVLMKQLLNYSLVITLQKHV